MSTYSSSLRAELITTGTQAGTWGNTTNDNLSTVFDTAIAGYITVTALSANQALTYVNGPTSTASANESIRAALNLTTSTTADFAVYAPPVSKLYVIKNSSSYTATIYNSTVIGNTTAAGTGVAIPAGKIVAVWSDGTNFVQQVTYLNAPSLASPTMTGTPTAPTATAGTNTTQVATTAFATTAVSDAIAALGTMAQQDADAVDITGGTIAGTALDTTVTAVTQTAGTADTTVATTAFTDRLRSVPASATTTTLVLGDRGSCVRITGNMTVPANVFASGDVVNIYNNSASTLSVYQGSGLTLRYVGTSSTGDRTLAQRGLAVVMFISATEAVISGGGLA